MWFVVLLCVVCCRMIAVCRVVFVDCCLGDVLPSCLLFVVCWLLCVVCCVVVVARCVLCVACGVLLVVCCVLFLMRCLLYVVYLFGMLCVVCCLLRCCSFVSSIS